MCHIELILITTVFRVIRFIPAGCTIKYLFLIFKILSNTLIIKLALGVISLLCREAGDIACAVVIRLQEFEFNWWVLRGLVISGSLAQLDVCVIEYLGGGELSHLFRGFYIFTVVIDTLLSYALIITYCLFFGVYVILYNLESKENILWVTFWMVVLWLSQRKPLKIAVGSVFF